MPGGDGTGPMGTGPIGMGLGPCGRGLRRGLGRGWRRMRRFAPAVTPVYREPTKEEEMQMLEEEQKVLKEEMAEIEKRVAELKGKK